MEGIKRVKKKPEKCVSYQRNKFLTSIHLPSSISIGSGRAGFVSGFGSISPGLSFRGSSVVSSSLSLWAALSLEKNPDELVILPHHLILEIPNFLVGTIFFQKPKGTA